METLHPPLEQFLDTFDTLSSEELERVERRLVSVRGKKNGTPRIPALPSTPRDIFAITFDEYLAMSDDERDVIQDEAYENYLDWIDQTLKQHHAKWILVCGRKVVESAPAWENYPTDEKLQVIGEQYGLIPFAFAAAPMIEETDWAALPYELSSEELDRVENRLVSAREKNNGYARISTPSPVAKNLFAISFGEYLAMAGEERDTLQISAYENYPKWIEQELARHDARWILVCGGKVVESGPTLKSYPRSPKVRSVGEQYGLAPFVFVRGPMIEESIPASFSWKEFAHEITFTH